MPNDQVRRRRDSAMISRMRSSCAAVNGCSGWQAIMLLPFVRGADMLPNPWGAGLRPAPVRSTVGLQHHHGETVWTNKRARPSRPLRPGSPTLSASSRSVGSSTRATCQASSSSCSTPFGTQATSSRFAKCRRGLNGSFRAHRIAFRFREEDIISGYPLIGGRCHHRRSGLHQIMSRCRRVRTGIHENVVKRCEKGVAHGLIKNHAATFPLVARLYAAVSSASRHAGTRS